MPVQFDSRAPRGPFFILKANNVVIRIGLDPINTSRMRVYLENSGVHDDAAARQLIQQMLTAELEIAELEIES